VSFPSAVAEPAVQGRLLRFCKAFAWRHPEWWSLAASAAAWVLLVARASSALGSGGAGHAAHQHGAAMVSAGHGLAWATASLDWVLMIVAMMVPLVVAPIRTSAARSFWSRRHRAIGGFLLGYLAAWALLGVFANGVVTLLAAGESFPPPAAAALAFAAAAAWQLTVFKDRALRGCHRTMPLAPSGWRADRDCLRYGWSIGCRCLVSCGALMVACVLAGHGMVAMTAAAAVGAAERYAPGADRRLAALAIATIALAYAGGALR
jgi:predicted metal-binding membrane protein